MAETKRIGSIQVVTDSETSYDNIGDVQGGFSEADLIEHLKRHGKDGLLETLAFMTSAVVTAHTQILRGRENERIGKALVNESKL